MVMFAQRYVKRPIEVEAMQWNGPPNTAPRHKLAAATVDDLQAWGCKLEPGPDWGLEISLAENEHPIPQWNLLLWVEKSQGWATVSTGMWIIKEPDGSGFYPCSEADFVTTYEPA